MDFGIVTAKVDEIGYIGHAENLGYSHCWVTDSPMIRAGALLHRPTRFGPPHLWTHRESANPLRSHRPAG